MKKNVKGVVLSKRRIVIGVSLGLVVTACLAAYFRPTVETAITGKTDLSAIPEHRLKELEKQAGSEEAEAAAAAVPTGPGYAQPLPESALRVPKEKK